MSISPKASRAILVLGMHRSGTSAITRVINLLGADLSNDLMPAAERNNPRGFWEHRAVVAIHEELLGALDRSWHDIRAMPDNWLTSEADSIARKKLLDLLSKEFSHATLWAVKDPRLSRLLPLWLQILGDMDVETSVVLVLRNPAEVAQSLAARDGLVSGITHLSWLQYMLEAEFVSRGVVRSVVSYDGLLQNWSECMLQLERELGFQWPVAIEDVSEQVSEFLDVSERHYVANDMDQAALPELVRSAYEIFLEKANGEASWGKIEQFNDIYQRNAKVFISAVAETTSQLEALKLTASQKNEKIEHLESTLVGLRAAFSLRAAFREIDDRGLPTTAVLRDETLKDVAKIYLRGADEKYSEARSARSPTEGLYGKTLLKFELESLAGVDFVRFDPSEFPGEFFLWNVQIDGKRLERAECDITAFNQYLVLGDPNGYRFKSSDEDPYLEMDIRNHAPFQDVAILVEVTCQRLTGEDESIRMQQVTQARLAAIETQVTQHQESLRSNHSSLTSNLEKQADQQSDQADRGIAAVAAMVGALKSAGDKKGLEQGEQTQSSFDLITAALEQLLEQQSDLADGHAEVIAVKLGALQDGVQSGYRETFERLEAMDTRVSGALAAMQDQKADDQVRHISQQKHTQEQLKAISDAFSLIMSEQINAIASLRAQTSNMEKTQQLSDRLLADVADQLTSLGSRCELIGRQSQELSEQQDVGLANQGNVSLQLRALMEYQQRSFLTRLRDRFSKKPVAGA